MWYESFTTADRTAFVKELVAKVKKALESMGPLVSQFVEEVEKWEQEVFARKLPTLRKYKQEVYAVRDALRFKFNAMMPFGVPFDLDFDESDRDDDDDDDAAPQGWCF